MEIKNVTTLSMAGQAGPDRAAADWCFVLSATFLFPSVWAESDNFLFPKHKTGENYLKRQNCQPLPLHHRCDQYHHLTSLSRVHSVPSARSPHGALVRSCQYWGETAGWEENS